MEMVRFLQVEESLRTLIQTLTDKLNAIQDNILFIFEGDTINVPASARLPFNEVNSAWLESELVQFASKKNFLEYTIGIAGLRLTDQYVYTSSKLAACISVADWENFSKFSLLKGLEYSVVGILLDRKISSNTHQIARGCPNDWCMNKEEIDLGLKNCDYCPECKMAINTAIERRLLTLNDVTAVYRILDDIAERKYCFVIMPFQKDFDDVFSLIKTALDASGYMCKRADEISSATSIVEIILEQIGRSSFVVADLTGRNANVFYELGYTHALGKNTVLIVQRGEVVPFDTRQRQYIEYDRQDLEKSLVQPLKRYIT